MKLFKLAVWVAAFLYAATHINITITVKNHNYDPIKVSHHLDYNSQMEIKHSGRVAHHDGW